MHKTMPVQVWADVDEGIAPLVIALNKIPGIRTHSSCQGMIGEGGAEPYKPYVRVTWEDETSLRHLCAGDWAVTGMEGDSHMGYVHPREHV